MHPDTVELWRHDHVFLGDAHAENERRTQLVVALIALVMVVEIVGGSIFGSMALLADGWHMSTHVAALGIAAGAYRYRARIGTTRASRSGPASSASWPASPGRIQTGVHLRPAPTTISTFVLLIATHYNSARKLPKRTPQTIIW